MTTPPAIPKALAAHRVRPSGAGGLTIGRVRYAPARSLWFLTMAGVALGAGPATSSLPAVALFLGLTAFLLLFGYSLGLHRKLAHGSFDCPRWVEYFLVYCGVLVGRGGPIGELRRHELRDYAEQLPDCHPFLRHGASPWRDAWWQLHGELQLRDRPFVRIEARISQDLFYRFLERTWRWQQLPLALGLYAWGGMGFVVWGVCARIAATLFALWLLEYFAHNRGPRHYEIRDAAVQGRNLPWTSLLTMGEGWHNNHHAYPGSARLGLYPGEWDPGWWTLKALRFLGVVSRIQVAEDLPRRPELANLECCELPRMETQYASD